MDIRAELEHENLKVFSKEEFSQQAIADLSDNYHVLLACDISSRADDAERREYARALMQSGIITDEEMEKILAEESIVIVIPFHSLEIAEQTYRRIPHASHFVVMYLDGEVYSAVC
jgi:endonuclease III